MKNSVLTDLAEKLRELHGLTDIKEGYGKIELRMAPAETSADEEEIVNREWETLLQDGSVKYSTEIVGLKPEETRVESGVLKVSGYPSDFKHWRINKDRDVAQKTWLTGPSGIVTLEEEGQTFYVFGVRKPRNLMPGEIETVPAGFLDLKYAQSERPFEECLMCELGEELGLNRESVLEVRPMRMGNLGVEKRSGKKVYNVCTDFSIKINGTKYSVQSAFERSEKEHEKIEFVERYGLPEYVERNVDRFNARTIFTLECLIRKGL